MGALAEVVVAPPAGWVHADVAPPKIAENAGATLASYRALASPDREAALVSGCVATPIPGWVDDMRPAIEARTVALAGAAAERIAGAPIDARLDGDAFLLRAADDLGGPPIGVSRAFLGWGEGRVLTCFAACASRRQTPETGRWHACEAATRAAVLDPPTTPPRPGLFLGAATWAVHHPAPAAEGGAVVVLVLGVVALVTRRRPRSPAPRHR